MGYSCIKQKDGSDCGAAVLATVALHYDMKIGLQRMRDLAGTDKVGTTLKGIVTGAEKIGFSARAVKGPYEALSEIPLPAVMHWKMEEGFGHFVVLHKITKDKLIIADPGQGLREMTPEEFQKLWTSYVVLLVPDENFNPDKEKHTAQKPLGRFIQLLIPQKGFLAEAFFCAILFTLLGLSTSYFLQHLMDSVLPQGESQLLNALGIGMIILLVFRSLLGVLRQYLLVHVSRKIDLNLISGYSHHIMRQPMKFFEMRQVGEILSRVNDAANIREAISGTTLTMIVDATLVIISMVVMFIYDTNLAWVACAFIPVFLIAVWAHHPPTRRLSRNVMESSANLQSHLVENISGADTTKAFGAEKRRGDEADDRLVKVVQSIFRLQKLNVSMSTIGMFITGAAGIVILWVGGHRVIDRALTIGELMFFYSLLGYMLDPLQRLSTVNLSIQDALVAVDRVGEIMDMESEKLHEDTKADITEIKEGMELRDTHFAYGSRAEVLKKVNIKIPVGKTIAIVGESGCGKSTLLKLLPRFYDPTKGQVILDGTDLRDIRLSSLRSKVGLVSQDTFLFTGSIQENIAFGRTDATMDEVTAAAKSAGLAKFINELPERYETLLGERGANFSGGQRQRLAIARVLLTRPEIIVFDEATSHLDTETELVIQKSIEENLKGRTIVMVAHRLSTICNADLIYVMHEGEIVEQGTHSELLKVGGRYSKLWRVQANDVIETRFRILDPEKRRSTDE